jgi:hypothetical protein
MTLINSITDKTYQALGLVLADGSKVSMLLRYVSNQQGWFYTLSYGSFSVSNRRIVTSPNMLRAFRDIIPFGLSCTTTDGYEPIFSTDFSEGRAKLYLLTEEDMTYVEEEIVGTYLND